MRPFFAVSAVLLGALALIQAAASDASALLRAPPPAVVFEAALGSTREPPEPEDAQVEPRTQCCGAGGEPPWLRLRRAPLFFVLPRLGESLTRDGRDGME